MKRIAAILVGIAILISGCHKKLSPEEKWEWVVRSATGQNAMWYRFTFKGDYEGRPFKIDQVVNCTRSVISGGSLGQSPDTVINQAHPMTAAAKMFDGSQVLVRIPDMCSRYRKFDQRKDKTGDLVWGYRPGWKTRGPHAVIPLVIWSDKMPKPDRIESYVSRDYYADPRARIKNPQGFLDLWPAGKFPENYAAVLKQRMAFPSYPNPWINPVLDLDGPKRGEDGRYHGKGDTFVSYAMIPVVNYNAWVEKWGPTALAAAGKDLLLVPDVNVILTPTSIAARSLPADQAFKNPRFAAYRQLQISDFGALASEPQFVTRQCVGGSLGELMMGKPGMSDLPYDAEDAGTSWPDDLRVGRIAQNAEINNRILVGTEARKRDCYQQLGKLRSFDLVEGRLDASGSIPGVLAYHKWWGELDTTSPYNKIFPLSKTLSASGAIAPDGNVYRLRISGTDVDYALEGKRRDQWDPMIFEDRNSGEWTYILIQSGFFYGKGENADY